VHVFIYIGSGPLLRKLLEIASASFDSSQYLDQLVEENNFLGYDGLTPLAFALATGHWELAIDVAAHARSPKYAPATADAVVMVDTAAIQCLALYGGHQEEEEVAKSYSPLSLSSSPSSSSSLSSSSSSSSTVSSIEDLRASHEAWPRIPTTLPWLTSQHVFGDLSADIGATILTR